MDLQCAPYSVLHGVVHRQPAEGRVGRPHTHGALHTRAARIRGGQQQPHSTVVLAHHGMHRAHKRCASSTQSDDDRLARFVQPPTLQGAAPHMLRLHRGSRPTSPASHLQSHTLHRDRVSRSVHEQAFTVLAAYPLTWCDKDGDGGAAKVATACCDLIANPGSRFEAHSLGNLKRMPFQPLPVRPLGPSGRFFTKLRPQFFQDATA